MMIKRMNQWRAGVITVVLCGLMGCQNLPQPQDFPANTPTSQLFKIERQDEQHLSQQQSLLALQYQPKQWRWVQTDPLGAPLARAILTPQGWQNDGFVMPNPQAKWLFSAIATALYPDAPLFPFSAVEMQGKQRVYFINHKPVWSIEGQSPAWKIDLTDHSHWRVTLLN